MIRKTDSNSAQLFPEAAVNALLCKEPFDFSILNLDLFRFIYYRNIE